MNQTIQNNKIEIHPFGYFLPENSNKLIIGSFPCFNGIDYGQWFYCGTGRNKFWNMISMVFSTNCNTLDEKKQLFHDKGIAITDIALQISRIKESCLDKDLVIIESNKEQIQICLDSGIKNVFFTSKFVEKQFIKQFPHFNGVIQTLPSPSPSSNRYYASLEEYKSLHKAGIVVDTNDYKLLKYKEALL